MRSTSSLFRTCTKTLVALALTALLNACSASLNSPAPDVQRVTATPDGSGFLLAIEGSQFSAQTTVTVNGVACEVYSSNAVEILCRLPAATTGGPFVVVVSDPKLGSTTVNQNPIIPPPTITSITPNLGLYSGGLGVTVRGTNFLTGIGVALGGSACTGVSVLSSTELTCATPAHVGGVVDVTVTNTDNQSGSLAGGFTYEGLPTITSVSPALGSTAGGSPVTITGTQFNVPSTVTLVGAACTVTSNTTTQIICTPAAHGAGLGDVVVTNSFGISGTATNGYTYVAPPPDPTGVTFTAPDSTSGLVAFTLGGSATGAQIAYQAGSAPADCNSGTVISAATIGSATSWTFDGLSASTLYGMRICAATGTPPVVLSAGVTQTVTTPAPAISCSSGTLDTTCTISSAITVGSGVIVAGAGSLILASGGSLGPTTPGDTFSIHMASDATLQSGSTVSGNLTQFQAKNLTVSAGASINADGTGGPGGAPGVSGTGSSPGLTNGTCVAGNGGAYAGSGGIGDANTLGAAAGGYGSVSAPVSLGSGGAGGCGIGSLGGNGGGAISLKATGNLQIDGNVTARGGVGPGTAYFGGGGSGGSIYAQVAGTFAGSGLISVDGGASGPTAHPGGGGGGGRIAITYGARTYSGTLSANGPTGFTAGGAGTIYTQLGTGGATLLVDNSGTVGGVTIFDLSASANYSQITVTGQGQMQLKNAQAMTIQNFTVASTGEVNDNGVGFAGGAGGANGSGPGGGVGPAFCGGASGGAHVGSGGGGSSGAGTNNNTSAGSRTPTTAGSGGGGGGCISTTVGGAGGGAVKLTVAGTLQVDGTFSADGAAGVGNSYGGGGGAGGSVWLIAGTLQGVGTISASGGSGGVGGGGGGGGEVSIDYTTLASLPTVLRSGGNNPGGSGGPGGAGGLGSFYLNGVVQ